MRITSIVNIVALWSMISGVGCQSAISSKQSSGQHPASVGGASATGVGGAQSGNNATGGTPALPSKSLTLDSASAHVDGRRGDRVRLTISGQQPGDNFAFVAVTALDANDNALYWFATQHTSQLDSTTGFLVPEAVPTTASFQFDVVVPFTNALLTWKKAKVALFDRTGAVSNELAISVDDQPVRSAGGQCDSTSKADRCDTKLDCSATSSTCVSHTGPSLTQVAYMTTSGDPVILATGADNADDTISMNIAFLDSTGAPLAVNMNNDSTNPLMATSFSETGGFTPNDGQFVFEINPTSTFAELVSNVSLSPVDALKNTGTAMTAALQAVPSRGSGMTCDIHGFDYCSGNGACVPGLPNASNICQPVTTAQSASCKAARVVDTSTDNLLITGYIAGASLWEPPSGCQLGIGSNNPEAVVKLHVAAKTAIITLSTNRPETQIDTVLYVATTCGSASPKTLGCNDNSATGGSASTLTLNNVAAGDYYVVVDSKSRLGGTFGLTVTVQ